MTDLAGAEKNRSQCGRARMAKGSSKGHSSGFLQSKQGSPSLPVRTKDVLLPLWIELDCEAPS